VTTLRHSQDQAEKASPRFVDSEASPHQARRHLETEEASFALEYIRSLSAGSIPHSMRRRIGESDLVQDTLLKAMRSFEQFRGTTVDCFRAWLRQIFQCRLKNLVRDHLICQKRSIRREVELDLNHELVTIAVGGSKLDPVAEDDCDLQIMEQCFAQLSASDQQVVRMHSRAGYTFTEIADKLQISEDAARKRYTRAIRRWRVLVERTSSD
jgi:RNA polymerase sigma-70 factor (ECF subfamily)